MSGQSLDQLGVPQDLRERAKILWIITLFLGLWGWIICNYIWKIEGQENNAWFQFQLKQSLYAGIAGWVAYACMGLGYCVHALYGVLGFLAINKGEDFEAPVIGKMARG